MTTASSEISPDLQVAPSPHIGDPALSTRRMMVDVLLALSPALALSIWWFRWYAVAVVGLSVLSCVATEALLTRLRGRSQSLGDGSAVVTGIILGLSMPWSAPPYVVIIAAVIAISLGKMAFGGLGMNLFNPAMVGRAFVTLSFALHLGASAYQDSSVMLDGVSQATPLITARMTGAGPDLSALFLGNVNGSLGETSALALLIGGAYLCIRRVAAWEIPAGMLLGTFFTASGTAALDLHPFGPLGHLFGGAWMLGAFYIATDPCSSPMTRKGRWIFGAGIGVLVVILRTFSSYPEGVMFAILIMNATAPLLNRWTIPSPLGGKLKPSPAS